MRAECSCCIAATEERRWAPAPGRPLPVAETPKAARIAGAEPGTLMVRCHKLPRIETICQHDWYEAAALNEEEHYVCTLCGLVGDPLVDYTGADTYMSGGVSYTVVRGCGSNGGNGKRKRNPNLPMVGFPGCTYNSKYHTNERLAQVMMTGPRVPHPILFLIKEEYFMHPDRYPIPEDLGKGDIARICRNTKVPPSFHQHFRSSKFPYAPFTSCGGYAERWYYIRYAIRGKIGRQPTENEIDSLKRYCGRAQERWNLVRHVEGCMLPGLTCHKLYGCGKNFPTLYFVMAQLCKLLGYKDLLYLFPVNHQPKTLKRLNHHWGLLCEHLDWPFEPWRKQP